MTKKKAFELAAETTEIAIKQIVDESVLNDVPVVGTILKLKGIGTSIHDNLYAEKIRQFLLCLSEIPEEKRLKFRDEIAMGKEKNQKLVQKLLLIIENQSDLEKTELVANFFIAYLDGEMSGSGFRRALDVTANYFLDDITNFLVSISVQGFSCNTYQDLERMGISSLIGSPLIGFERTSPAELRKDGWGDTAEVALFETSDFGFSFERAFRWGERLRNTP